MRIIPVTESIIGSKIGKDIYSENGKLLLAKGVVLTNSLFLKLQKQEIFYIYIDDDLSDGIEPRGIVDDHLMLKSVSVVRKVLDKVFKDRNKTKAGLIPFKDLQMVESVISEIMNVLEESNDLLYTVVDLMGTDMYTYKHSVNVSILSIMTAKSMGYDYKTIKAIALGAMLHDIGKVRVKDGLISKQGKLSDEEFQELKSHSERGYELIKDEITMPAHSKQIIRYHHEKLDGSGYPLGLSNKEIPDFVKIVTICDIFDALTSDRAYRKRIPIYKALEIIMGESVYKLDQDIYRKFIENVCVFPPGTEVLLSDKRRAIVSTYKKNSPSRPIVRIIDESNPKDFEEIDLSICRTIFIEETL